MIKAKARQVPIDEQSSHVDFTYVEWEGMAIDGNGDYPSYYCDEYIQVKSFLEHCLSYKWQREDGNEKLIKAIQEYLNIVDDFPIDKAIEIWDTLTAYDNRKKNCSKAMVEILTLYTGHKWEVYTIRGYVQAEWQNVYYETDLFSFESIKQLQSDYFNLGTEWKIEDENDHWFIYCYEHDDDKLKKEISDSIGYDISEIKFEKFDGYTKVAKYTEF